MTQTTNRIGPKIGLVQPLDHPTYDRVYNGALFHNSTEYRRADGSEGPMFYYVKPIVQSLKPKTMLSIGAGTAAYDAALLRSAGHFVDRYIIVEPNPHHAKHISDNLTRESAGEVTVIQQMFGPEFELAELSGYRPDLIMFAHSLYFIPNPEMAVKHALSLLAPGGKLLIQHGADDTRIREGYAEFNVTFGLEWPAGVPRQDHLITIATISRGLTGLGIEHTVSQEPATFFVDSFYNGDDETALLLLCFMMNTDVRKFPQEAINSLRQWVKDNSSLNAESNRYELPHPQGFILIEG